MLWLDLKKGLRMPRLKTTFIVEFEYDALPEGYGGVTDPDNMAAIDQMGAEENPERSLEHWLAMHNNSCDNIDTKLTIDVASEVIHD